MHGLRQLGWAAALAVLCAGTGVADELEQPPCLEETQRLCPLVPGGLVRACLQAHDRELSAACRKRLPQTNDDIRRVDRDCAADAARLCPEPQTTAGQRVECLFKHRDALSRRCQDVFDDLLKK